MPQAHKVHGDDWNRYYEAEPTLTPEAAAVFAEKLVRAHETKPYESVYNLIGIVGHYHGDVDVKTVGEELGVDMSVSFADGELLRAALAPANAARKVLAEAHAAEQREKSRVKFEDSKAAIVEVLAAHPAAARVIANLEFGGKRGSQTILREFEVKDDTNWFKGRLGAVTNPHGGATTAVPPYEPEPSGFALILTMAVTISSSQEAYADYSTTVIPVAVKEPTDIAAAHRNLGKIARKLQTHNGWAGSGSTWEFSLHVEEDGAYVLMTGRHSISD